MTGAARADVVTDWNSVLLDVIREDNVASPVATRAFAMMNLAMFDTINSFEQSYDAYLILAAPGLGAVADVSAASAAHRVLSVVFPGRAATFDTALDDFLPDLPDLVFAPSRDFGVLIANAVINFRFDDNSELSVDYTPGSGAGEWQPTPPTNAEAQLPNWPFVTPFAMASATQFRPTGAPDLTSARYTADFIETKAFGEDASGDRSDDQTEVAHFWADGEGTATGAGHWIEIAITIAAAEENTAAQNARVFALLSLALADGAICAWDAKYAFDDWRPVTAIRNAGIDGNDATIVAAGWTPLIETLPHPGYVSENAVYAGAASKMMEIIYGRDSIEFTATSDGVADASRTFNSLSGAAEEAAFSGVLGGTHFGYQTEDGLTAGQAIAAFVHANYLRKSTTPTTSTSSCAPGGCGAGGLFSSMLMIAGLPLIRRSIRRQRRRR